MELNEYASVELPPYNYPVSGRIISGNQLEKLIILLVAILGLIGSGYIIASSTGTDNQPEFHNLSLMVASAAQDVVDPSTIDDKSRFSDYIKINGKKRVDNKLRFEMLQDLDPDVRYWVDMGDGTRVMVRRPKFYHAYKEKGTYTLSLKQTKNAVVTNLAETELKIK